MRRLFIWTLLWASALSSSAEAGSLNLAWGAGCWADNPSSMQAFACNSDTGSFTFTASFVLGRDLPQFTEIDAQVDLQSDGAALPDWWQLSVGGCRAGALSGTADFQGVGGTCTYAWPGKVPFAILDWRTAAFPGGVATALAPNRAQLLGMFGSNSYPTLRAGVEYYAFSASIAATKTLGMECTGCAVPAAIVLNEIRVYGAHTEKINTPLANGCLRWQTQGTTPCSATPTRNRTWGAIKSLYR